MTTLEFKLGNGNDMYTTDSDEELVADDRPEITQRVLHNIPVEDGSTDVYIIGKDYRGIALPLGVRCVHVLNYTAGGQRIIAVAEHYEFHKVRPVRVEGIVEVVRGKELDVEELLDLKGKK
ncbi:hypothetical protein HYX12_02725 [Candidatus Woesearchaeota archaeon]|nr:hypothetical protein [Candidatus Woesearchaeota archaeon]